MTKPTWFAAALVMAIINEHGGLWRRATSVVLLRATDFDDAFVAACEIGHGMEETYVNGEGDGVRWAFERVMTLDMLPERLTSGTEVYSEPHQVDTASEIAFDSVFTPELHKPEQSGVSST
jgi:Domain of unknown function (DUF4288)